MPREVCVLGTPSSYLGRHSIGVNGEVAKLNSENVCGLMCELCQSYKTMQKLFTGTWTVKPCTVLRKDVA